MLLKTHLEYPTSPKGVLLLHRCQRHTSNRTDKQRPQWPRRPSVREYHHRRSNSEEDRGETGSFLSIPPDRNRLPETNERQRRPNPFFEARTTA